MKIIICAALAAASCFGQDITSGLIAHYTFDTNAADVSGNGNNATPDGLYQYVTGHNGNGLRIIGDNSLFYSGGGYIQLPTFGTTLNSGFSFSLWVKDETIGGDPVNEETYISYGIGDEPTFGISLNSVTKEVLFYINAGLGATSADIPQSINFPGDLSRWKHLVVTYTPGKVAAYFNGAKIGEKLITVNVFPVTKAALGRHWWSGGAGSSARMSVTFDDVRVYSRALTDADVQQLYVTESTPPQPLPAITTQPTSQTVIEHQTATFSVIAASSTPLVFQWNKNGAPITGAVSATYRIPTVQVTDAGTYSVSVTNSAGTTVSNSVSLAVSSADPGRFINLSVLGNGGFTAGFVVGGSTQKTILVRAVGPSLKGFGVANFATSTSLTLYGGATLLGANSGWSNASNANQIAAVTGPFPLVAGSADSALLVTVNPGDYTAQATANGAVLIEVYEVP